MKKTFVLLSVIAVSLFHATANAQIITTFAGGGPTMGDGGPATAGAVSPNGIATDNAGNVYICSGVDNHIRKVDIHGIITTYAGTGTAGHTGDGGPATAAELYDIGGLATDGAGNLYIAEAGDYYIRKVDAYGIITTIAGNGTAGDGGDGGPATAAQLWFPNALATDAAGNIYVTSANARVRRIDAAGVINTFAGTGVWGYSGDGGPATDAQLKCADGIQSDAAGNIYFADHCGHVVRKISKTGIITTIAGTGIAGHSGDGGLATVATLNEPTGIVIDPIGNIYIGETGDHYIRKVTVAGIISTAAGTGTIGFSGDGGPATVAKFGALLQGLASDCGGNVYITDQDNLRVREIVYTNHPYFFGENHTMILCLGAGATDIDALLRAMDIDTLKTLSWNMATPPLHGTVAGLPYTTTTTGDTLTPAGLWYTPAPGYTGSDSFRVAVSYCNNISDTVMIHVNIYAYPVVSAIGGAAAVCTGKKTTLTDATPGGVWSAAGGNITIDAAGAVTGITAGTGTISYTVSNAGCATVASYPMTAVICPVGVQSVTATPKLNIYPNPVGDVLHIDGIQSATSYRLLTVVGAALWDGTLGAGSNAISVQQLPAGVYLLEVSEPQTGVKAVYRIVKK